MKILNPYLMYCVTLQNVNIIYVYFLCTKVISTALNKLKSPTTEAFYRRQAWEVVKHYIVGMISLEDNKRTVQQLLTHSR